jgi:hypothetical protein
MNMLIFNFCGLTNTLIIVPFFTLLSVNIQQQELFYKSNHQLPTGPNISSASYSGGPSFTSWPRDEVFSLKFFVVLLGSKKLMVWL